MAIFSALVLSYAEDFGMDPKAVPWLVLLDCHWSHRCPDFLTWAKETFPNLIIMFVPPSCTSLLQPLDVHFNGPFKAYITSLCVDWLFNWTKDCLVRGVKPNELRFPNQKSDLVAPFCSWVSQAAVWARSQKEMILSSWKKCGLNLAWAMEGDQLKLKTTYIEEAEILNRDEKLWTNINQKETPLIPGQVADLAEIDEDDDDNFEVLHPLLHDAEEEDIDSDADEEEPEKPQKRGKTAKSASSSSSSAAAAAAAPSSEDEKSSMMDEEEQATKLSDQFASWMSNRVSSRSSRQVKPSLLLLQHLEAH